MEEPRFSHINRVYEVDSGSWSFCHPLPTQEVQLYLLDLKISDKKYIIYIYIYIYKSQNEATSYLGPLDLKINT